MSEEDVSAAHRPATMVGGVSAAQLDGANGAASAEGRAGAGRLCGYEQCRAALPTSSGPGNRARYCQDGTRWGSKALSCKQAALALENARSLPGGDAALTDASVTALAEQVTSATGPALTLVAALRDMRHQLEDAVTAAHTDRARARAGEAEARGQRDTALAEAADARQRATEAERAVAAATARRDDAQRAQHRAEAAADTERRKAAVADGRRADAADAAARAERRAHAAADRTAELDTQLGAARAELEGRRQQLADERTRRTEETERAERADEARRDAEARLVDAQAVHLQQLTELRDRLASEHDARLAALYRQVGATEGQLAETTARAETTSTALTALHTSLTDALAPQDTDESAALRHRMATLLEEHRR